MKINFLLVLAFLSFVAYANIDYLHGIVGMTLRDGGLGCICHNFSPNDSVNVWIEGPDSLVRNTTRQYKLYMTGGPAIAGGFNIASNFGTLDTVDTLTQILFSELTHSFPNQFTNDTVSWNFLYQAPDTILTDTIYSVGNSVNRDSIPGSSDQWNFGQNFVIHVIDFPVNLTDENSLPTDFILYQNFPNPFNPKTVISYQIPVNSNVTLKVFDVLGNEIAVLVDEYRSAGKHEIDFSFESVAISSATGIYFYQLKAGNFISAKKMLLLK